MRVIYFDNAATSYPKPRSVGTAMLDALNRFGGNPGRSGHTMSAKTAQMVYDVRERAARFFSATPENTVFTQNCTQALNMAIKGVVGAGDHIIISSLEHNSVSRPVYALNKQGAEVTVIKAGTDDETLSRLEAAIRPSTKAVAMTVCSNVTGQLLPIKGIAEICGRYGVAFIADAAQAAGVIPLSLDDGIDIICAAGHKGLYGPTGTGLLVTNGRTPLKTIIEGGTGATSLEVEQTDFLPERLESGTLNTVGIAGLGAGLKFIERYGMENIRKKELSLTERFIGGLEKIGDIEIIGRAKNHLGVVSFIKRGVESNALAGKLNGCGFCLRAGYQCAALAHRHLHTEKTGAVRFSPSVFNTPAEVDMLIHRLRQ